MNGQPTNRISVTDPIAPAIERVKLLLFKPFDISNWFVIGFCAWLAQLGKGGGFNFNFGPSQRCRQGLPEPLHHAKDFVLDNLFWVIPVAAIIFLFIIAVGLALAWLNSRGRFMFLHCVATNKAEVKVPWYKFRQQGNSLFLFRLAAGVISFLCVAILVGVTILCFAVSLGTHNAGLKISAIAALVFLLPLIITAAIAFLLLFKFTNDFVVPIMYLRNCRCLSAWREFLTILKANKARFILYLLFQIVIAIAIFAIIAAATVATCCCAACILLIPYIGTVLMLPLLVFTRAYSLMYIRQFGAAFDVFLP